MTGRRLEENGLERTAGDPNEWMRFNGIVYNEVSWRVGEKVEWRRDSRNRRKGNVIGGVYGNEMGLR